MNINNIIQEFKVKKEYIEILKRILEVKDKKYFEWWEVRAHPSQLMKLLIYGLIDISPYSSSRRKRYKIKNPQLIEEIIRRVTKEKESSGKQH